MVKFLERFESAINVVLAILMVVVVLLATLDLGWMIAKDIVAPPVLRLDVTALLELFAAFLLVLIGIELLHTVKVYLVEHTVHVEVILAVALVAIARKVIVLEVKQLDGPSLIGIAAIIASLAGAYYAVVAATARRAPTGH